MSRLDVGCPRWLLGLVAALALLAAACGGDDGGAETPNDATATVPADGAAGEDDESDSEPDDGADGRLLPGCRALGSIVEEALGDEVIDARGSAGGGLEDGVSYSTVGCTVETEGAAYSFDEYVEVEVPGDGGMVDPLARWAQVEAAAEATVETDERAEQVTTAVEAAGGEVDGVIDDDGELVLLIDRTTYAVSFGLFDDPTPSDLEGLAAVAVAVAVEAPDTVEQVCVAATEAVVDSFGALDGEPRAGGSGGGSVDDITYQTETCTFELAEADLDLRVSISDDAHWEAANARSEGPFGRRPATEPVDGVGDAAYLFGDDLVVRINDQVIAIGARSDGDAIPPGDLVELAAAVLER